MKNIHFDTQILQHCPLLRLGCLVADIEVIAEAPGLWPAIEQELMPLATSLQTEEIGKIATIAAARQAYKALGKDPSRYRPSAEALLRRVVSGKGLYSVNNVVNLINLISARSGFSIGGYDPNTIVGDEIRMSVGHIDDVYEGLGRGLLNIEALPVLRDAQGAFGCPTSDSLRTSIQAHSTQCLWVFFDFGADESLEQNMQAAATLLEKYAQGKNIKLQLAEAPR